MDIIYRIARKQLKVCVTNDEEFEDAIRIKIKDFDWEFIRINNRNGTYDVIGYFELLPKIHRYIGPIKENRYYYLYEGITKKEWNKLVIDIARSPEKLEEKITNIEREIWEQADRMDNG